MKKLLLIADNYPFGKNEGVFILPELPALMKRFEVVVVSINCTDEQTAAVPDGVRVIRVKMDHPLQKITGRLKALFDPAYHREYGRIKAKGDRVKERAKWALSYYAASENFAVSLRRELRKINWRPDIIYCFWHMTPLYGVLRRKNWFGCPAVVSRAHGRDLYEFRSPFGYQPFKQESDMLLDAMYLISELCARYYGETYSVSQPPKYSAAYLGTEGAERAEIKKTDTLRLFSCSNVIPLKRIELIIEALALIDDVSISWTHAGDGESMEKITALAEEKLSGKSNISFSFLGRIQNSEVKKRLSDGEYDFFITTSQTEGLPVSIIEAYSAGVPAIATAVGGIPEVVDSSTGFLLGTDPDPQQIADLLRQAAGMTASGYQAMSDNAYARWQKDFVAGENAERFASRLEELCK